MKAVLIAGCDEAGRGALAGPVVAGAVVLAGWVPAGLADSKKLTPQQRIVLFEEIVRGCVALGVGCASAREVERLNVRRASVLAMHRALNRLVRRGVVPVQVLVDGNYFEPWGRVAFRCVVGGDGIVPEIMAASIVAKVVRDRLMERLARLYPQYGWYNNKGYPTRAHIEAIFSCGRTPHHRRTFMQGVQLRLSMCR